MEAPVVSKRFVIAKRGDFGRDRVRANVHAYVDALPDTRDWRIEIREARKERTLDQNAAMFGVAYATIMESAGLEGDDDKKRLHWNMCGDFFGWVDKPLLGRVPVRTTTTNENGERDVIDTATAARMYDFIQRQAAEYGIVVPDPDPFYRSRLAA
jgi:hypothetical protein